MWNDVCYNNYNGVCSLSVYRDLTNGSANNETLGFDEDLFFIRETARVEAAQPPRRQLRRSSSEEKKMMTKGAMFAGIRQQPSHYTVHPDWASEAIDPFKKK